MVEIKIQDLLKKQKISRYKMCQYTGWNPRRINAFYFGKVKQVTVEEINKLCEILNCNPCDFIKYTKTKEKK